MTRPETISFFHVFGLINLAVAQPIYGLIARFPDFLVARQAEPADDAYWFRNATTVATSTVLAVPAMLTGKYPTEFKSPHFREYPETLFTLLGHAYDVEAWEVATNLCPDDVCEQRTTTAKLDHRIAVLFEDVGYIYLHEVLPQAYAGWLPPITQGWQNFGGDAAATADGTEKHRRHLYTGRQESFLTFVDNIRPSDAPKLSFLHINLPHIPYQHLPSGATYPAAGRFRVSTCRPISGARTRCSSWRASAATCCRSPQSIGSSVH